MPKLKAPEDLELSQQQFKIIIARVAGLPVASARTIKGRIHNSLADNS